MHLTSARASKWLMLQRSARSEQQHDDGNRIQKSSYGNA
jgi:hypothetical protein